MKSATRRERRQLREQNAARYAQLDQIISKRSKYLLIKRVIGSFILIFLIIFERVISDYTRPFEVSLISELQALFGVKSYADNFYPLKWINVFHDFKYFHLVLLHIYLMINYLKNPIIAMKILIVHYNLLLYVANFDIFFEEPRPFWISDSIVGVVCEPTYAFPSFSVFSLAFLMIYGNYCFERVQRTDEFEPESSDSGSSSSSSSSFIFTRWRHWNKAKLILYFIGMIGFSFFSMVAGLNYLSQIILAILYTVLAFYLAIFFEKSINFLVMKSSFLVEKAKKYSIIWIVYVLIAGMVSSFVYNSAEIYLNTTWIANFFRCVEAEGDKSVESGTYYHTMGPWPTYLKTSIIFGVLGVVMGVAYTFRKLKGIAWFDAPKKERCIMAIIANVCVVPLWFVAIYQTPIMVYFAQSGLNNYLFYSIYIFVIYYLLFGVLPITIFKRFNLLNLEAGYITLPNDREPEEGQLESPTRRI